MTQREMAFVPLHCSDESVAQDLHGAMQVPEAERCLSHLQHGGAVERCCAVGRFLGIELQLQIKKVAQPLIPGAATKVLEIGHGQPRQEA